MGPLDILREFATDYTLRTVALGSATLGIVSGALGAFAVLRRQSLLGDAISHAALPGIAIAFLLTGSKEPLVLILGAAAAGWIGTLLFMGIIRMTRVKDDSALGLVLSVFFGFGLVLLTFIQRQANAAQAGLDKFLFGQAAALLERDVVTMAALGFVVLGVTAAFWKEFKLLSFDPDFGASVGFPVRALDVVLTSLLVVAIVIGLQTVGVVLMSAMVVAPAAAARQWTDRLGRMVALSAVFGALAGVAGALVSALVPRMPTGPTIVLAISAIVVVSLLFAPNRGILRAKIRQIRNRRELRTTQVLADLYALAMQHGDAAHAHEAKAIRAMRPGDGVERSLAALADRGYVRNVEDDRWVLTPHGLEVARRIAGLAEEPVA